MWWALLLGFHADAIVFGPVLAHRILTGEFPPWKGARSPGPPRVEGFWKRWVKLYNLTHSMVVFIVVAGIVWIVCGTFWVPLLGWLLHILVDIPTHSREFFPTPFLWPFSSWTFDGWSWARMPLFWWLYGGIMVLLFVRYGPMLWRAIA